MSDFQDVELLETGPFGKVRRARLSISISFIFLILLLEKPWLIIYFKLLQVLLLDGKLQSAEADERVYHECLVHPAMLHHPNPKKVFICGGGEGSTAREVLKHKSVEKLTMVDIDKVVCDFCEKHLEDNAETFKDPRLELIIDDAKAQLEG